MNEYATLFVYIISSLYIFFSSLLEVCFLLQFTENYPFDSRNYNPEQRRCKGLKERNTKGPHKGSKSLQANIVPNISSVDGAGHIFYQLASMSSYCLFPYLLQYFVGLRKCRPQARKSVFRWGKFCRADS